MGLLPTPAEILYMKEHINDTKVPGILASNIVCLCIAFSAVSLRFISRRLVRAEFKIDDWMIVLALVGY